KEVRAGQSFGETTRSWQTHNFHFFQPSPRSKKVLMAFPSDVGTSLRRLSRPHSLPQPIFDGALTGRRIQATHGKRVVLCFLVVIQHGANVFHSNLLEGSNPCRYAEGKWKVSRAAIVSTIWLLVIHYRAQANREGVGHVAFSTLGDNVPCPTLAGLPP